MGTRVDSCRGYKSKTFSGKRLVVKILVQFTPSLTHPLPPRLGPLYRGIQRSEEDYKGRRKSTLEHVKQTHRQTEREADHKRAFNVHGKGLNGWKRITQPSKIKRA
ncbi:hypothetical protein Pmani_005414 [Petrolisthes manimaculis]|uniref:Uncharacterized protein n=1 Tax=Petrolisthes manimaculis TaxID=1843537 RepID=A0AAE1QBP3_9EUCA|nr:hypothetical protein Pmani_005414 [Petrolisthes manimaculis]